ncbi:hypothetical protein MCHI_000170 [Candidatus Magnetoovum chiemensis]|nr:hypothetical protein MCHI_000170 [Candidatus Magnetoovum chiemensis]
MVSASLVMVRSSNYNSNVFSAEGNLGRQNIIGRIFYKYCLTL